MRADCKSARAGGRGVPVGLGLFTKKLRKYESITKKWMDAAHPWGIFTRIIVNGTGIIGLRKKCENCERMRKIVGCWSIQGFFYANYQELNVFLGGCLRKNYENTKALRKREWMQKHPWEDFTRIIGNWTRIIANYRELNVNFRGIARICGKHSIFSHLFAFFGRFRNIIPHDAARRVPTPLGWGIGFFFLFVDVADVFLLLFVAFCLTKCFFIYIFH